MSAQEESSGGAGGVRVLYVEDNQQTGPLVRDWLERHDHRFDVSLAVTIEEGLEYFEEAGFDIVIADYRFPEGTGLDLLAALRDRGRDVPFLLYSARADDSVKREAREAGVDAIVHKGDATQLGELAERVLDVMGDDDAGGDSSDPDPETVAEVAEASDDRLEAFAADISHDLRGPLSLAYGHLDMAAANTDDEHLGELRDALEDLEDVVNDLRERAATFEEE